MRRDERVELNTIVRWLLGVVCLLLAGCVTHQSVENKYDAIKAELKPGDLVEVRLSTGEEMRFEIAEIRETEIVGDMNTSVLRGELVTVPLADIQEIVHVDRELGKKTRIALGVSGAVVVAVLIIAFFTVPMAVL